MPEGSLQMHLAEVSDAHAMTLRRNLAATTCRVESQMAAALAPGIEIASLWKVTLAHLGDDVSPASSPVASLSWTDCLSSLHTVGCGGAHRFEGKRARLVLVGECVGSRPGRAQGDFHPVLELVRRPLARPQLNLRPIEGLVAVDHQAHLCRGVPGLDLSGIVEVPGLVLVAVAALPELNLRSILIPVAVDHNAVIRILMHPDATGLVQEEVLPAAVPLLIAVPELNLHTVADAVSVAGEAKRQVRHPCQVCRRGSLLYSTFRQNRCILPGDADAASPELHLLLSNS
mmetsp:Transcript_110703/g.155398  ORF Transcript_110703/g.155398 Transcript_110703/m.155398 type:complete len:287 (+) Transcript_110703:260-1120(+)